MATPRTFKLQSPHMQGNDIRSWQRELNGILRKWEMDPQLVEDGDYGQHTRAVTASVCHANGFHAGHLMRHGVTPWLRTKVRHYRRSVAEKARFQARRGWRRRLRRRYRNQSVAPMVGKVIADSWGYHPPGHDGLDVITRPNAPIYAMCDAKVVRVSPSGWWGQAPSGDVSKGDGIVILRCETDQGPFRRGLNIGYGHSENHTVRPGQRVKAGDQIGHAGLAVAWHIHLMVNDNRDSWRGVGDRDPRPYYNYAQRSG